MLSVRVAAAGAVVAAVVCFAAPAGAVCDFDRTPKKCDREIAAREQADSAPVAGKRKSAKRVKVVFSRRAKHTRLVKRTRAPGFAVKREGGMELASASSRMTTLLPESVLARRFRGFINPMPLADNSFEVLRKPHLVAHDLDAAAILPAEAAEVAPATAELPAAIAEAPPAAAPSAPSVVTTAKQDRVAPRPPAQMELASAESRPVTLAPAAAAAPVSAPAPAAPSPPMVTAQASMTEAAPAQTPSSFSFHGLVLALCGALGAASALRFIVGA